ncbi:peptidoglycan/LPS O-acetylase OafA/YrhL [Pseudoduganella flava]|uniref:Acyltransferase family protein n=1 Tax=Pseudoduganella flava TaxID=871742 RepID=A0A562PSE3_9BURK|nr:acyltransferase family protein [Pseudoduganella flava]QGZ39359.1 acyltransferase family protein [Pseudoduganella flava]TWI47329.1 peptidoglycan/LPS O-acetylase OafA/YrhL [Pseudoduganella flava]
MTVPTDGVKPEFGLINLLKAGAAQLIVLHHLAFYGPMADHVRLVLPDLIDWLGDPARIAVQVFLVIGGFLAAKSLSPTGRPGLANPRGAIWRRYVKLAPPFIAATLLAAVASALAAEWMTHDSISAPATLAQLCAHAVLLHGVLGYESLSAGAWYVAIDFQLYGALALLLWLGGRIAGPHPHSHPLPWLMPALVAGGITFSLLYFNLDGDWDVWAPYFFGSYGLGVMAWWAGDRARKPGAVVLLAVLAVVPVLAALVLEFRSRIALALAVACVLFLCGRIRTGAAWSFVNRMGRISYAVFLVHFPVCLVVNAAFTRFVPLEPAWQGLGMLCAWGASLAAGAAFFRWVEVPLGRAFNGRGGVGRGAAARPIYVKA